MPVQSEILSIQDVLARETGEKPYLTSLASRGYEMGVGRAGTYDGHAHRGLTDIAFAPGGLRVYGDGHPLSGLVHIIAAGQWFGPIEFLSDFWFIKFFESELNVCHVPDKIIREAQAARRGAVVLGRFAAAMRLYGKSQTHALTFECSGSELKVVGLPSSDSILVVRA